MRTPEVASAAVSSRRISSTSAELIDERLVTSRATTPGPVAAVIFVASWVTGSCQSVAKDNCETRTQTQKAQRKREEEQVISGLRELKMSGFTLIPFGI